jgi:hypothetical protein
MQSNKQANAPLVKYIITIHVRLGKRLPIPPFYLECFISTTAHDAIVQSQRAVILLVWTFWVLSCWVRSRTAEMAWIPDNSTPRHLNKNKQESAEQENCPGLRSDLDVVARRPNATEGSSTIRENLRIFGAHNGLADKGGSNIRHQIHNPLPLRINGTPPFQEGGVEGNPRIAQILDSPTATRQFWHATCVPPITKQSLSELDINSIISNSKLRHDVNFDRELHFRPNLDGHKGQLKRETQKAYWEAVTAELTLYHSTSGPFTSDPSVNGLRKDCQRRIPQMFGTIKEILKHLVPERDQPSVDEHLDVPMVMQEIEKGVFDFVSIAVWLAQLLKCHCAPMRDEMVDRMVDRVRNGDPASMSAGLCELFGVLEAMKLVSVR